MSLGCLAPGDWIVKVVNVKVENIELVRARENLFEQNKVMCQGIDHAAIEPQ
jgi:hypothetical protein